MTSKQVNYLLNLKNIPTDSWVSLIDDYPMITLLQNSNIYVRKDAHYKFNSSKEILEIVYGRENEDGSFISNAGELSNYIPTNFISYKIIYGFIQTIRPVSNGTYRSII